MAKIKSNLSSWITLILFIICSKSCNAKLKTSDIDNDNIVDFEKIKLNIFTTHQPSELSFGNLSQSDEKCLGELRTIGIGLLNKEQWAIKIVDAWGKIPSGILEGNYQEFGSFSECLNIERDSESYRSKYCMANVNFVSKGLPVLEPNLFNMNNMLVPNMLQMDDEPEITPRRTLPIPKGLVIGICVPAACSTDFLKKIMNFKPNRTISLIPDENSCQLEEYASELRNIDWVTIGLLAIVSFIIVVNTSYDIFCTINNREKSQALLAFSFYTNGMKLLSYEKSKSPDMMHCLHGIRVISTAWVVLGHTYAILMLMPIQNKTIYFSFVSAYHNMIIQSAHISVDTFFVMSGLLVSINMLKHLEKTKGRINVPLLYFHRFIRLTPLLAVTILFSMSLMRFMGSGPIWPRVWSLFTNQCEKNYWTTLLYIQNYVHPNNMCLVQSWYLAVDTQLFLLSPLVVYLIYRFKLKAIFAMTLLVLGCIGCTLVVHLKYDLHDTSTPLRNEKAYVPTHIRYGAWLIGVIAGYFFYNTRNRSIRIPRLFNLFAWALSLAIMATVIFVNYPLQQPNTTNTPLEFGLYDALSRTTWSIALCYIIFACVHNSGGPVNWFLGHPLWQPISRICYAIYIVHFTVVIIIMVSVKSTIHFSELSAFHTFIGNFVITVFVSIIVTLAFESPIIIIEKLIFGPRRKKNPVDERGKNEDQDNKTAKN